MPRQFAGRDQDRIEAHVADRRHGAIGQPDFRRRRDALFLPFGDRPGRVVQFRAGLYFDENQRVAAGGDDIDFAERAFPTPRQDPVAMRDQPGGGAALGGNAEVKGNDPLGTCLLYTSRCV